MHLLILPLELHVYGCTFPVCNDNNNNNNDSLLAADCTDG